LYINGISFTCPWQVEQPMPLFTWMLWLKKTKIRQVVHARPLNRFAARPLSRIGCVMAVLFPNLRVAGHAGLVAGRPAKCDVSTPVWQ